MMILILSLNCIIMLIGAKTLKFSSKELYGFNEMDFKLAPLPATQHRFVLPRSCFKFLCWRLDAQGGSHIGARGSNVRSASLIDFPCYLFSS